MVLLPYSDETFIIILSNLQFLINGPDITFLIFYQQLSDLDKSFLIAQILRIQKLPYSLLIR